MNIVKLVVGILLWIAVVGLAYWLYRTVDDPVKFKAEYEVRSKATKTRLLDIKVAQEYFKDSKGTYASNFDHLINTLENDKLTIIKASGDKDDTTINVVYDTILISIKDEIFKNNKFKGTEKIQDLKNIPFTNNTFELAMDTFKQERVEFPVFEAKATKDKYLDGLDEEQISNPAIKDLSIGSLTKASGKGSWQ